MKKVLALALIGLVLTGCTSTEDSKKELYSVKDIIEEGNKYLENGDYKEALDEYSDAIELGEIESEIDEAFIGKVNVYKETYNSEAIKGVEEDVDSKLENPSKELLNLIKEEKDKKWFKVETIYNNGYGFKAVSYKYDDKGRVIESYSRPFNYHGVEMVESDYTVNKYEYLDNGYVIERVYHDGVADSWAFKYKIEDGYITECQTVDSTTGNSVKDNTKVDMSYVKSGEYSQGFSTYKFDKYGNIESVYYDDGLQPHYMDEYTNEYDDYGNLIRVVKTSFEEFECENNNKYVYCNPEDLNGDLSSFKTSTSEGYDYLLTADSVPATDFWMNLANSNK